MAETDEARIARWVIEKLAESGPYVTLAHMLDEIERFAEEIEEQSAYGITKEEVIEWVMEYYMDELVDLIIPPPSMTEEQLREYVKQVLRKLAGL